jgi:hypothetical protein
MNQMDICDKILNYCLTTRKPFHSSEGLGSNELELALNVLSTRQPIYLCASGNVYSLTADGEAFILSGGYAGRKQMEIQEKAVREEERELIRQVNQSILDTNKYVRETQDNQKRLTRNLFIVVICALLISLGSFVISILNMYLNSSELQLSGSQQEVIKEDSKQLPENSPGPGEVDSK